MLADYAYCPREVYIELIQGDFEDNEFTVEGRWQHRRVDKESGDVSEKRDPEENVHARSVYMSAPRIGLVCRADVVEVEGTVATPVEYKHGKTPKNPERSYDAHRVQVCAQALVLEENGFQCVRGILYYIGSKQRVEVELDEVLRRRTLACLDGLRRMASSGKMPLPLEDSQRCVGCSLTGICLPDEVSFLRQSESGPKPRRLTAAVEDGKPLYVRAQGAKVRQSGEEFSVEERDGTKTNFRMKDVSHVVICGKAQMTTDALREACVRNIPVSYVSLGHRFYGSVHGFGNTNVELRRLQFKAAEDAGTSLVLAKRFIAAKIHNCRTLLRRNGTDVEAALVQLHDIHARLSDAHDAASLLGMEGSAARVYFAAFAKMFKPRADESACQFDLTERNRRPPKDPVNAMLSFAYSALVREVKAKLFAVGFDPFMGFYHRPVCGRPALALDLMEQFRPVICDSVVLTAINKGMMKREDFVVTGLGVQMSEASCERFIGCYEQRMDELASHPLFGYKMSYRRVIEMQCRLLGSYLRGEIPEYPEFLIR